MEQNNFEKQVQQKMEELKIHPSESAWNNIEKRIGQKRERRRWVFILSLSIFLILFTAFYLNYHPGKTNISQQKNERSAIVENKIENSNLPGKTPVEFNKNHQETENKIEKKYVEVMPENARAVTSSELKNNPKRKINDEGISKAFSDSDFAQKINKDEIVNDNKIKNVKKSLPAGDLAYSEIKIDSVIENAGKNITVASSPTTISDENIEGMPTIKKGNEKDTTAVIGFSNVAGAKKIKSDWKSGFTFSSGKSIASYDLLSQNKSNLYYSSPVTSGGNPNPGYSPSKLTSSFAFSAGVFFEKDILAKSKISFGLNYTYFSTKNKVGNKFDSVQTNYNSTNPLHDYNNKFYFVELPLTLKLRLNPKKSSPLYWNAGISISEFISSNALQFNSDRGLYYNDNSFFNKTQIGFSTGFLATLFSESKVPVNIGPYFYYGATKLANKGLYNKTHFSSIGISAQILLNKK